MLASGKKVEKGWKAYLAAAGVVAKKEAGEKAAAKAVAAAKVKCIQAQRRVFGKLTDRHPDDQAHVESFFPKYKVKAAAKGKPGDGVPAGTPVEQKAESGKKEGLGGKAS